MAGGPVAKPPQRKRNRKRKRRNVSDSDDSSSDSSSSESATEQPPTKTVSAKAAAPVPESSTESSEDDSSSSEGESDTYAKSATTIRSQRAKSTGPSESTAFKPSASFTPPVPAPTLFPARGKTSKENEEQQALLKDRFRKFWMTSMADAFSDDLNEIRKEPNMTTSRLELLVESLAAGADLYSSTSGPNTDGVNEMEVILDGR